MGKHAEVNRNNRIIANTGVAILGAGASFFSVSSEAADGSCPAPWVEIDPGFCELAISPSSDLLPEEGALAIQVPAGATKVQAILISESAWVDSSTYAGGEVFYDDLPVSGVFNLTKEQFPGYYSWDGWTLDYVGFSEVIGDVLSNENPPDVIPDLDGELWGSFDGYPNWATLEVSGQINVSETGLADVPLLPAGSGLGRHGINVYGDTAETEPGIAVFRVKLGPVAPPAPPAPRSYEGPINFRTTSSQLCSNSAATVTGERLSSIQGVQIAGTPVTYELRADGSLSYSVGNLQAGTYTVSYWIPANSLYLTDKIKVGNCSNSSSTNQGSGSFSANRVFANYQGDRGAVQGRDLNAIQAFVNRFKGIENVTCVGSTSGVPAKPTDAALALARAKSACDVVTSLVPDAKVTLKTSVGKGIGQQFRSVHIFVSGNS